MSKIRVLLAGNCSRARYQVEINPLPTDRGSKKCPFRPNTILPANAAGECNPHIINMAAHWRTFLHSLLERELSGIQLIISDAHTGLQAARRAVFGGVPWQRCQFHLQQNAQAYVPNCVSIFL